MPFNILNNKYGEAVISANLSVYKCPNHGKDRAKQTISHVLVNNEDKFSGKCSAAGLYKNGRIIIVKVSNKPIKS